VRSIRRGRMRSCGIRRGTPQPRQPCRAPGMSARCVAPGRRASHRGPPIAEAVCGGAREWRVAYDDPPEPGGRMVALQRQCPSISSRRTGVSHANWLSTVATDVGTVPPPRSTRHHLPLSCCSIFVFGPPGRNSWGVTRLSGKWHLAGKCQIHDISGGTGVRWYAADDSTHESSPLPETAGSRIRGMLLGPMRRRWVGVGSRWWPGRQVPRGPRCRRA
jgi:hypothetical protein